MDYQTLFSELNSQLAKENLTLEVTAVGGFVMEHYGLKATSDIDAFYQSTEKIEKLIHEVGEKYHANTPKENWLNHAVDRIISAPSANQSLETIYEAQNLIVRLVSLRTVLIDKLIAQRQQDVIDAAKILIKLNIKEPDSLWKVVSDNDGSSDPGILLDVFARAYGEDWLIDYLSHNPQLKGMLRR